MRRSAVALRDQCLSRLSGCVQTIALVSLTLKQSVKFLYAFVVVTRIGKGTHWGQHCCVAQSADGNVAGRDPWLWSSLTVVLLFSPIIASFLLFLYLPKHPRAHKYFSIRSKVVPLLVRTYAFHAIPVFTCRSICGRANPLTSN